MQQPFSETPGSELPAPLSPSAIQRQRRLSVLAQAPLPRMAALWRQTGLDPDIEILRGPENGLVALRGRIGGTGQPFQVGEVSATRVTVRIIGGAVGHAMITGRDNARAQLAATLDALAEDPALTDRIEREVITPLEAEAVERDAGLGAEVAATRVNFFTLVRGDD